MKMSVDGRTVELRHAEAALVFDLWSGAVYFGLMGARGSSESLHDKVLRLFDTPAARNQHYSAREIIQRVDVVRAMRAVLPSVEAKAIEAELPRGLLGGFEDFVDRGVVATKRLSGSHPKRLRMLHKCMADLPFTLYKDLMALSGRKVFTHPVRRTVGPAYGPGVGAADREAVAAKVDAAVFLIKFLAVLTFGAELKFPVAILLELLELLLGGELLPSPAEAPARRPDPVRTAHPPGRVVVAGPCVARAPGRGVPLCSTQRGPRWAMRVRGNALAT